MGLFNFGKQQSSSDDALSIAENYIRQDCSETHISALVRHYHVEEVTGAIARQTGVELQDNETEQIVQAIRDEYDLGPIEEYNKPKHGWFW